MEDQVALFMRAKAFDAAAAIKHESMADLLMDARIAEGYLTGADRVPTPVEGPVDNWADIPHLVNSDGERIPIVEETIVTQVTLAPGTLPQDAVVEEPKAARTRKAKPAKKPKAVRKTKARDEAPVASQESGSQVPESGDHVPDNDAADPNTSLAA